MTQLKQRAVKIQIKFSKANKSQTRILSVRKKITTTKGNSNMGMNIFKKANAQSV